MAGWILDATHKFDRASLTKAIESFRPGFEETSGEVSGESRVVREA